MSNIDNEMNKGVDKDIGMPTNEEKTAENISSDSWVCPVFKVSGVFSSHMVLQRDKEILIWGFSDKIGSRVSGSFMGEAREASVGEDNRWELRFSPRRHEWQGQTMTISDDRGNQAVFDDILIGDVWMIHGQSNASLALSPCLALTPSVDFSENDNFRLYMQYRGFVYENQEYCNTPQRDVPNPKCVWRRPDEDASREFSALGWYFAKKVTNMQEVPLGLIVLAAGGACIREYLPEKLAHDEGYLKGANVREAGYFNSLVNPFIPLPFKGMIFFQGESEGLGRRYSDRYAYDLALLVADERARFGFDFPFYNIQLSNYREEGAKFFPYHDIVRAQQFDALKLIPNSALTVDMDLGSPEEFSDWAHSPRKLELAERVADLILAKEYNIGKEADAQSPMPAYARLSDDKKTIEVAFENVNSGLIVSGHDPMGSIDMEVKGFYVGEYESRQKATAHLKTRYTVTVDVPEGVEPTHIGYALTTRLTNDDITLRNSSNLPCPAFYIKV